MSGEPRSVHKRQGAYLPHWTADGATYAITYRLVDSVPQSVLEHWELRLDQLRALPDPGPLDRAELSRLQSDRVQELLDSGAGECELRQQAIASIVWESLFFFESARYTLDAACVMPNHVHVVVTPMQGFSLPSILHTWKSFTSHKIGLALGRGGSVWAEESYDHLVRNERELVHAVRYIVNNPRKAKLGDWPWLWVADRWRGLLDKK